MTTTTIAEPRLSGDRARPAVLRPLAALALLVLFNAVFTPGFLGVDLRDGGLYGAPIDILNHGSKVAVAAVGMTLVIATRGVDLSVGAVAAVAGAAAAALAVAGWSLPIVLAGALGTSIVAGVFNGVLVAALRIQPIVATLVLMVCGRGAAQLICEGQVVAFAHDGLAFIGGGTLAGIPFPVVLAGLIVAAAVVTTRRTALGLFVEAIGSNPDAARASAVPVGRVVVLAYAGSSVCAGVAGLIAAGDIKAADANHAGLYLELDAILAVVLGGTALTGGRFHIAASAVGAILIQALTTTLYMHNVSPDVALVPKAIVVILVCLLSSPTWQEWRTRWRSSAATPEPPGSTP